MLVITQLHHTRGKQQPEHYHSQTVTPIGEVEDVVAFKTGRGVGPHDSLGNSQEKPRVFKSGLANSWIGSVCASVRLGFDEVVQSKRLGNSLEWC